MKNTLINNSFFHNAKNIFLTKVLIYIFGMISSIYLSRILEPSGKGAYAIAVSIAGILVQLCNLGMHSSHTYYISRNISNLPMVIGDNIIIFLAAVLLGIVLIPIAPYVGVDKSLPNSLFILAVISFPFTLINTLFSNVLIALNEIKWFNTIELLNSSLYLIIILTVSLLRSVNVYVVVISGIIATIVITLLAFMKCYYVSECKVVFSLRFLLSVFPYGLKAYIACLISYLILRVDIIMLSRVVNIRDTGIYSLAVNLSDLLYMIASSVATILFPSLASIKNYEEKIMVYKKVSLYSNPIIVATAIIMELVAGIIPIIYGNDYKQSVLVFRILVIAVVFWSLSAYSLSFLGSENDFIPVIVFNLIALFINVILNWILIQYKGIEGAAIASVVSYGIYFMELSWYMIRIMARKGKYAKKHCNSDN